MRTLINRPVYMEQLISFREKQIIKVVTGIRRCGKSTLFDLYDEYLRNNGVQEDQIIGNSTVAEAQMKREALHGFIFFVKLFSILCSYLWQSVI